MVDLVKSARSVRTRAEPLTLDSTVAMKGDFGPSIQHNGRIGKHDSSLVKDRLRWWESP
jgi:hypothetical protein